MYTPANQSRTSRRLSTAAAALVTIAMQVALATQPAAAADKKSAPAPKAAAPKAAAPKATTGAAKAGGSSGASHGGTAAGAGHAGGSAAAGAKGGSAASGSRPAVGTVKQNANGTKSVQTSKGEVTKASNGRVQSVKLNNGHEAKFGSNGRVKEVHAGNMTITHAGNVHRSVVENRETHTRFVAEGHGRGYIEHRYEYGGHAYYARGYYYHGGYYRNYYHPYYYGGVQLYGYVPAYYYPTAYYGWAYNPWPAPAPYAWGWGAAPWYGYYGAYFAPYPVYPAPAYWLADYMIAATLQASFVAAAENANVHMPELKPDDQARYVMASYSPRRGMGMNFAMDAKGGAVALTPEVKKQITDEITLDLAAQKAGGDNSAAGNLATLLADGKPHTFVAGAAITATSAGQDCAITEGDVLSLPSAPAKDAENANLSVLASKSADCGKGSSVAVPISDLQEMHNHMLASIDKGLGEMKDNPGKGIPAPPADATAGAKEAPYAAAAPPPDPDGAAQLDAQAKQADQTEQEVVAEANSADDSGSPTTASAGTSAGTAAATRAPAKMETITIGQTVADVVAMKGQPKMILNPAKTKQIYVYPDMKITFVNGKLTDAS